MANKKRLVWTDDVMAFLCKRCNEMYSDEPCEPSDCLMLEELDKCPTVEVVYGYWIERPLDCFRKYEVKCSECGFVGIGNYDQYLEPCDFNYCPNCGADMQERKDNA